MRWQASWIWWDGREAEVPGAPYNETVIVRREFEAPPFKRAWLAITADAFYRLVINGMWVNDGPARGWPEHYYYDMLDVGPYLRPGANVIEVTARHFGRGDFHHRPQRPGLLAQLELTPERGPRFVMGTGADWSAARAVAWAANTPKISCQMEPQELYDARRAGALAFAPARVVCAATAGPWGDLQPRDVALLTREPRSAVQVAGVWAMQRPPQVVTFPIARLLYPERHADANVTVDLRAVAATCLWANAPGKLRAVPHGLQAISLNGAGATDAPLEADLRPGENLLLLCFRPGAHQADQGASLHLPPGVELRDPLNPRSAREPWRLAPLNEGRLARDDMRFIWFPAPEWQRVLDAARTEYARLQQELTTCAAFKAAFGTKLLAGVAAAQLTEPDPHHAFIERAPVRPLEVDASALLHDNADSVTLEPVEGHDLELCLDFGTQTVGYYELDLTAPAGTVVDLSGLEFIRRDGVLQLPHGNRNGLRYVCGAGRNRFTSLKRRSQRYLYVTLRGQRGPVRLRLVRVIESTYPTAAVGAFACSAPELTRIWEISARTLKLCMEDTFTDCPLYEQTHWVGDARNEGLYAMTAFGAADLVRRCIRLTGQSLERYPLVGGQTPSSWDMLLPAWSFLWGISVWDYFEYAGDHEFLREAWPWVEQNLRGAQAHCTDHGLFSGPYWNMFDWSGLDDQHETVLHNSLLLVGAIDAGLRCAAALEETAAAVWLKAFRRDLVRAINRWWDAGAATYPDALHAGGAASGKTSVHTLFLGLLYGVIPSGGRAAALRQVLRPPKGMTPVGAPFAVQYLYEALEQAGEWDAILDRVLENYLPMLREGATTVWEQFASSIVNRNGFPTRSHCHAWSSAPIYFLNRIVLGLRPAAVGGAVQEVSPWVRRHTWAQGASQTQHGPVRVEWERRGKRVEIHAAAPPGVRLRYKPNASLAGLDVSFNDRPVAVARPKAAKQAARGKARP